MAINTPNLLQFDNGVLINGNRINCITSLNLESKVDGLTEVKLSFIATLDGLDNIVPEQLFYSFKESDDIKLPYKPHRKYH